MGWNDSDKEKDRWNNKDGPPDIDEALKRLQAKLRKVFFKTSGPSKNNSADDNGGGLLLGAIIVFVAFILWALSGIFIVDPAERAAILRFGKYVETVGPGPHWIPRLISSKVLVNVDRVSDYSYTAQMLTKDENLVSVAVVVQYRIGDLEAYLFNVADPIESLQQATSSALRQVVGHTTLDEIITEGREAWGNSVQQSLIEILASYKTGIMVVNVSPQPARAPENVQDAFDDAIKAQEDEKRFKEQARAYEARVVPIAEGNAKRIIAEAQADATQVVLRSQGETAEFSMLLPEYLQAPQVTAERMYLDTMQMVLSKSSKVVVNNKSGNILYLPLDKLVPSTLETTVSKKEKKQAQYENEDDTSSIPLLADKRQAIRKTERPGRSY